MALKAVDFCTLAAARGEGGRECLIKGGGHIAEWDWPVKGQCWAFLRVQHFTRSFNDSKAFWSYV